MHLQVIKEILDNFHKRSRRNLDQQNNLVIPTSTSASKGIELFHSLKQAKVFMSSSAKCIFNRTSFFNQKRKIDNKIY